MHTAHVAHVGRKAGLERLSGPSKSAANRIRIGGKLNKEWGRPFFFLLPSPYSFLPCPCPPMPHALLLLLYVQGKVKHRTGANNGCTHTT